MIVIAPAKLRFLLAGRVIEVDVDREYRKGRSYALGLSHKRSICRVEIVERFQSEDGRWRLRIRRATDESPRLLAANPAAMRSDYTNDPHKAARGEPEALSDKQLEKLRLWAGQADARRNEEAARQLASLSPSERLAHLERVRKRIRVDIGRELRIITQRIERAERKLRNSSEAPVQS